MFITTEQVWHVLHAPLLQFIRTRVADDSSAEDILQEVFLKIHQHIETLKDVKKLDLPDHAQRHYRLLPQQGIHGDPGHSRGAALVGRTS